MASVIYLDYHATTPVDPRVLEEMLPYFRERFGNAASHQHLFGWAAAEAVELARSRVASLIGADPAEIIFTSGATESINLALKGVAKAYKDRGRHLATWVTEHKATLDTVHRLEQSGCRATYLPVDHLGMIDPGQLEATLGSDTILTSLLLANNEIGVIQPVAEIGAMTRGRQILLHVDAAQAVGKIPIDVNAMKIDLLSMSGHKLYGPKGIGALYVRRRQPRVRLTPTLDGGGHERGLRSGTLNVPGIVGLGKACEIAAEEMAQEHQRVAALRDRMWSRLSSKLEGTILHGHPTRRLAGNLNISFEGVGSSELLAELPQIALSSGSACTSAHPEPSHVIRALGVSEELAKGAIRVGLGRFNTEDEIDRAGDEIIRAVKVIRNRKSVMAR
ncbi:MAG: aminotransferase class V-fold PLP-dependent enzyme [Acidobacteria bacterium]|nr:aminotransferase class V-fold PLP-dependent enzyme [Acidobacteriota bacterium]